MKNIVFCLFDSGGWWVYGIYEGVQNMNKGVESQSRGFIARNKMAFGVAACVGLFTFGARALYFSYCLNEAASACLFLMITTIYLLIHEAVDGLKLDEPSISVSPTVEIPSGFGEPFIRPPPFGDDHAKASLSSEERVRNVWHAHEAAYRRLKEYLVKHGEKEVMFSLRFIARELMAFDERGQWISYMCAELSGAHDARMRELCRLFTYGIGRKYVS